MQNIKNQIVWVLKYLNVRNAIRNTLKLFKKKQNLARHLKTACKGSSVVNKKEKLKEFEITSCSEKSAEKIIEPKQALVQLNLQSEKSHQQNSCNYHNHILILDKNCHKIVLCEGFFFDSEKS